MAAKLVQTLADDNPDLQKQIGCMTGIFHLFDGQQMVNGRCFGNRRLILPANPQFSKGGPGHEYNGTYLRQHVDEPNNFPGPIERQRFSTESSRASISSSCSSSLSSWECGRSAQPELSPFDRVFSEDPSFDSVPKQAGSSSPNLGRKPMDLRDVVKDSMYRETGRGGLQVKPKNPWKSEHRDGLADIDNVPTDIKEPLKVLANLRESQWYCNDVRQLPTSSSTRDQSSQSLMKDAPRFSYDGREQMQNRLSFESRETIKSSMKLKELPRLSFDSRDGSFPSLYSTVSLHTVQKSTEKVGRVSNKKRPPSVVAKLMGLEALPDTSSANENAHLGSKNPDLAENFSPFLKASKRNEMSGHMRGSNALGSPMKKPELPRWGNPDGTKRPMPRVPNEPAPWRQYDGNRVLQKPVQKSVKVMQKTGDVIPSVYGEIEKRLKDLEFKQSGKNLRALKQIMKAIQAKGLLESRKEDQATNIGSYRYTIPKSRQISRMEMQKLVQGNHSLTSTSRGSDDAMAFESPIVIIKPSKLVEKDGFVDSSMIIPIEDLSNLRRFQACVPADTQKSLTDRRYARYQARKSTRKDSMATSDGKTNSKNIKPNQTPSRSQPIPNENSTLLKNSSSVSPRLQQKKLELERRARLPTPPSDANKSKWISSRQTSEAFSPGGRNRVKYSNSNPSEDQISEVSNDSRAPSYQGDDISVHSDGNNFLGSKFDIEVSSQSLSIGSFHFLEPKLMPMDVSNPPVDEDEVFPEFTSIAAEHHSPVSVLDPSAHIEDDQTPVKLMQNSSRESSSHVSSHDRGEDTLDAKMDIISTPPSLEMNQKKLQNIERLVQKLRRVNATHDEESTDYIAPLCENSNSDHRYISEILLASGFLLRDLGSGPATFQLHSSGQAINPELFSVLEQTKFSGTVKEVQTKIHRKLIFDVVNDILTDKLMVPCVQDVPWLVSMGNLVSKTLKDQKLLKELCMEIELLEAKIPSSIAFNSENDGLKGILWEDVVCRTGSWTYFGEETSAIVLGIERLLFKDLVNEILVGCGLGMRTKPSRPRELYA